MSSLYDLLHQKGRISAPNDVYRGAADQTQYASPPSQPLSPEPVLPLLNIPKPWVGEIQRIAFFLSSQADASDNSLSVAFSSMRRGAGTTTISYLVANYLAAEQSHKRVLYIDYAPGNVGNRPSGSGNSIKVGEEDISRLFSGNLLAFDRISIFPGSNVSAPVSTRWFREFMEEARKSYQIIIADTPPFFQEPGSYSLAMAMDGVVLVLQAGETRYPAVNTLVHDLEDLGIQTLGGILNRRRYPIPRWLIRFL